MNKTLPTFEQDTIKTKTIGHCTVMGTQWPRDVCLRRLRNFSGKIRGYAVTIVCNGTIESDADYKFKATAQDVFNAF